MLGKRTPDDPLSEFRTGERRLLPETMVPLPMNPRFMEDYNTRKVFGAAQQASKY